MKRSTAERMEREVTYFFTTTQLFSICFLPSEKEQSIRV